MGTSMCKGDIDDVRRNSYVDSNVREESDLEPDFKGILMRTIQTKCIFVQPLLFGSC